MKAILTTAVFFIFSFQVFAQTSIVVDTITAYRLVQEGDSLYDQNKRKQACALYKQAIGLMSWNPVDPQITRCLNGICFYHGNIAELDSLDVYAELGYQLSLQLEAAGRPPLEDFYRHRASYFSQKGQFPEAIAWFHKGLDYRMRYFPDNVFKVAEGYNDLGITYSEAGQLDSAMLMYTEMLRLMYTLPKDERQNQLAIAQTLQNQGILYKELGEYAKAISTYEQALATTEALQNDDLSSKVLYNMGYALHLQGDLDRALDYYQKAGDLFVELYGDKSNLYAIALNKIAGVHDDLGNFDTAKKLYEQALAINLDRFGPDHPKIAIIKNNLSVLLARVGQYEVALQLSREAVEILDKALPTPHPLKVSAYINLILQYYRLDIQQDSMAYFSERAVTDAQIMYGERSELTGMSWRARALAFDYPGHKQMALEAIQKSLIASTRRFTSQDIRQNPASEDFFRAESGMAILESKAAILASLWQNGQQPEQLELALQCLEDGNTVMQHYLRSFGGQTGADYTASESFGSICKAGIEFTSAYYNAHPNAENMDRCFLWMERDKSQKLLLAAKNAHAKKFAGLPDSLLQHDAALAQKLTQLEKKLLDAEEAEDSVAISQIRNEQLFAAKNERNTFVQDLEHDYPAYFSLKYQVPTVRPDRVQALLSPEEMVLEITFGDAPADSLLFLFSITSTSQKLLKVLQQKGLADKITRLNGLLQNPSLIQHSRRKEFSEISGELYAQFIEPIADQLSGIKKIIIVGEGITHLLPFEVLFPENLDKPFQEMDFLVKHFEISYHYSATLWASIPKSSPQFKQDLLAFAPVFDGKDIGIPVFGGMASTTRDSTLRAFTTDGKWTPLPWTEKEVTNIAKLFKANGKSAVNLLMRDQADEQNLNNGLEQGARCIHLASHSFANLENPKFSGIACFSDNNEPLDGTLYVGELYNLRIAADLVVLSSCESGKGKLLRAEGPLGLNRAFLYAGVPNVLFTLWKINDRATADFSNYFYRAMLQGQSYSAALRSAKLKMLANPATALPMFWSGFLLIGK